MKTGRYCTKTRWQAAGALAGCLALLAAGCSAPGGEDAARSVDMALRALGGAETVAGWETQVSRGLMKTERPGWGSLQAECTHYVRKPDMLVLDQDFSAYGHPFFFRYTYNAGEAWVMVNLGIRQNPRYNEMLEEQLRTIDGIAYHREHCDTFFTLSVIDDADTLLAGVDLQRIAFVAGDDTVYYDLGRGTHLPLRRLSRDAQGTWSHTLFDDYRKVAGRRVPFHETTYTDGRIVREMIWREILFDVDIDPDEFEKNRPRATGA